MLNPIKEIGNKKLPNFAYKIIFKAYAHNEIKIKYLSNILIKKWSRKWTSWT